MGGDLADFKISTMNVSAHRSRGSEYIQLRLGMKYGDDGEEHVGTFFLSRDEAAKLANRLSEEVKWLINVQPQPEKVAS
jgi:hypothetical protein